MSSHDLQNLLRSPMSASADEGGEPERPAVVIVDDDPGMLESLEFVLQDNYTVTLCSSAEQGVAAIHDEVCAAILDVKMSVRDGFWACNEMRRKVPDLPVIFYSGYQNLKDPFEIINEHRPFGYVVKGDDFSKLVEMLEVAVMLQATIVANRRLIRSLDIGGGRVR